jgi:hypothetical protein
MRRGISAMRNAEIPRLRLGMTCFGRSLWRAAERYTPLVDYFDPVAYPENRFLLKPLPVLRHDRLQRGIRFGVRRMHDFEYEGRFAIDPVSAIAPLTVRCPDRQALGETGCHHICEECCPFGFGDDPAGMLTAEVEPIRQARLLRNRGRGRVRGACPRW